MQCRNSIPRIMVVDNAEDILLIIKMRLEEENFKVDIFTDAKSALEAFERHFPDYDYYKLVLIEITMPDMNGFALYLYLREKNPYMKIAFMTAVDMQFEEFRDIIPAIDINDIINKPFNIDDLAKQIRYNLES
jgi:two-component system OmpR family response regulator